MGRRAIAKEDPVRFATITACIRESLVTAVRTEPESQVITLYVELIDRNLIYRDIVGATMESCVADCRAMIAQIPTSPYPLERLLELALQDDAIFDDDELDQAVSEVHRLDPDSAVGLAWLGASSIEQGKTSDGLMMLERAVKTDENCLKGLSELAKIAFATANLDKAIELAVAAATRILQLEGLVTRRRWDQLFLEMKMYESRASLRSFGRLSQAAAAYETVLKRAPSYVDAVAGLAEVSLADGNVEAAKGKCAEALALSDECHTAVSALAWVAFMESDLRLAEELLRKAIKMDASVSAYHYRLGRVLWEQSNTDTHARAQSLKSFIVAVQKDPYNSQAFAYLGHFYRVTGKSHERAIKCYEKCVSLSPLEFDAAQYLTKMHAANGNDIAILRVCKLITDVARGSNMVKASWAWKEMAKAQQRLGNVDDAVVSSQTAVWAAPRDPSCWLLLGESYACRGSFLAALKAFEKSIEIDPEQPYCISKAAAMQQALGRLPEAIELYNNVLKIQPTFLPALVSAADAWFNQGREFLSNLMFGAAIDAMQKALAFATSALTTSSAFACIWKLVGDICTSVHALTPELVNPIEVPKLPDINLDRDTSLMALGTEAYKRVISLNQTAAGWTDLAMSYLYRLRGANAEGNLELAPLLGYAAMASVKRALSLNPSDSSSWNILGVVATAVDNLPLAQHAYIKSLELSPNVAQTWVNLGALYLLCSDVELANKAFAMAQAIEPTKSLAWAGQAMVAEFSGSAEALDLYRHAYELHPHPQACLGFSYYVILATSVAAKNSAPVTSPTAMPTLPRGYEEQYLEQALVALTAYTRTRRGWHDTHALNCLGMLMERRGAEESAVKYYSRSAMLLCTDTKSCSGCIPLSQLVKRNLARALSATGNHLDAITTYQDATVSELNDICGFGLAFYAAGKLTTAYKTYEKALAIASAMNDKNSAASVLIALATVACANSEFELAKKLLFQSSNGSEFRPRALYSLGALGLVTGDAMLAASALGELSQCVSKGKFSIIEHSQHLAILQSAFCRLQGLNKPALRTLSKAVHVAPHISGLWSAVAALSNACPESMDCALLDQQNIRSKAEKDTLYNPYTICAVSAHNVQNQQRGEIPPGQNLCLDVIGQLVSGKPCSSNPSVSTAMKAVQENPASMETWATLSAAAFAQGGYESKLRWVKMAIVAADKCLILASEDTFNYPNKNPAQVARIKHWAELQSCTSRLACAALVEVMDEANKWVKEAAKICQKCARCYSHDRIRAAPFYAIYCRCLLAHGQTADGFKTLTESLRASPAVGEAWEAAGVLFDRLRMPKEAILCYRQCLALTSFDMKRLRPLLRLATVLVYQGGQETELDMALTTIESALKINNRLPVVRLCFGIIKLAKGDRKGGRKELGRIVEVLPLARVILDKVTRDE